MKIPARHPIARYLVAQAIIALLVPIGIVEVMILADVGRLASLIAETPNPRAAAIGVFAGAVTTLSPMVFATAVALLRE